MPDDVSLLATADDFARDLLADANDKTEGSAKPPLEMRVAVLKAVTSFLAVRNKLIEPPPPDEERSEVAEFQRELAAAAERPKPNGRAPRNRRDPIAKNETLTG